MQDNSNNLLVIIELFWANRIKLLIVTIVSAALSIGLSLNLPNQYQSVAVVAPVEQNSEGNSSVSSLKSNLASITGVNVSTATVAKVDVVLETLQSKKFILEFIDRHKIKIPLMAGYKWDDKNNVLVLDNDIYNKETKKWNFKSFGEPPREYVYDEFMDHLTILTDINTGIVKISFQFLSPELAQRWVMWLIKDINEFQRQKDIHKSDLSIQYLQTQISQTNIVEVKNIFYELIKEQLKVRLLANTRDEYVLSVIDPAIAPDIKSSPKRPLIIIVGVFLGFFIGFVTIYFRHLYSESTKSG